MNPYLQTVLVNQRMADLRRAVDRERLAKGQLFDDREAGHGPSARRRTVLRSAALRNAA